MHEKLIHRSRRNLEASAAAARWTSELTESLETRAREAGYEGRLSQECLDELQAFLTGLLKAQHDRLWNRVQDRRAVHDFARLHRERRDELTREVYGQLVELRGLIRSLLGKGVEKKLFGTGRKTPREPWELARVAHNVIQVLRQPRSQAYVCKGLANEALWKAVVEKMSEPLEELWKVLHELVAMENDERAAVDRLHEAKDRLHRSQLHVFRLQESLCEVAGREDLVEDVRPDEPARRKRTRERSERVETGQIPERAERKAAQVVPSAPEAVPETEETGSDASKPVPEEAKTVEAAAPPVSASESSSQAESHPVRKVLKWIQAVPHRVRDVPETPETAVQEVDAA